MKNTFQIAEIFIGIVREKAANKHFVNFSLGLYCGLELRDSKCKNIGGVSEGKARSQYNVRLTKKGNYQKLKEKNSYC